VILSFDGVTKRTLEKIRVGADYNRILSNIMALHELKKKHNRTSPLLFMDFVLMNSNIHEAPAFVGMCAKMGIAMIDFRHLVGNIYFSEHEEMPDTKDGKYNYYRQRIIEESKKYNMDVRLPEAFDTTSAYIPDERNAVCMTDFNNVIPDIQTEEIKPAKEVYYSSGKDADFAFLANASCLRPFSEIMITEDGKIMPCSYYSDAMGVLGDSNTLHSIFFNDTFRNVRRKKLLSRFDHNCMNCPIMMNLLPTEIVR
jgi:radical SAM protein with 4Fe4S-binding SPASM domain